MKPIQQITLQSGNPWHKTRYRESSSRDKQITTSSLAEICM